MMEKCYSFYKERPESKALCGRLTELVFIFLSNYVKRMKKEKNVVTEVNTHFSTKIKSILNLFKRKLVDSAM